MFGTSNLCLPWKHNFWWHVYHFVWYPSFLTSFRCLISSCIWVFNAGFWSFIKPNLSASSSSLCELSKHLRIIPNKDQTITVKMTSGGESSKAMTKKFAKLDKFEGQDFRRWQKKMHFLLTTLKVVYVLSTQMPGEVVDEPLEQTRKRGKWLNADYICRGHILNGMCDSLFDIYQNVESAKELWELLEAKYMAEDTSSKKFLVSDFMNYKMVDGRPIMEQYNECLRILGQFEQHGLKMDEAISVPSIIDKLPPSWKDFKHTLKHKKEEMNLVELGSCFRIEESCRAMENVNKDKHVGGSSVNMVEESGPSKGNNKKKFQSGPNKKNKAMKYAKQTKDQGCWKCGKLGHFKRDCRVGKAKNEVGTSGSSKDPKQQG